MYQPKSLRKICINRIVKDKNIKFDKNMIITSLFDELSFVKVMTGDFVCTDKRIDFSRINIEFDGAEEISIEYEKHYIQKFQTKNIIGVPCKTDHSLFLQNCRGETMTANMSFDKNNPVVTFKTETSQWLNSVSFTVETKERNTKFLTMKQIVSRKIKFKNILWTGNSETNVFHFKEINC